MKYVIYSPLNDEIFLLTFIEGNLANYYWTKDLCKAAALVFLGPL